MSHVAPYLYVVAVCLVAAAITTGPPWRRALGIVLSSTSALAPWMLAPEQTLERSVLAMVLFVGLVRVGDLRSGEWTLSERLWHAMSVVDTRKLSRSTPSFEGTALLRLAFWEALGFGAYWFLTRHGPRYTGVLYWIVRWGSALVFVYAISDAAYALLFALHRAVGLTPPLLHRSPAAARSVQEFWGKRWNRTVSAWLDETFFRPFARRGSPLLGVTLAFLVSGVVHAYITYAGVGGRMAWVMLGYFLFQGLLVLAEAKMRTTRWSPASGRAWTLVWMAALSPMFTEPLLKVMGA